MTGWCIAAIPRDDDPVWKYSSEKVPHMTLLFLGEQDETIIDLEHVSQYIQHLAETTLQPFYMTVDNRGPLGSDNADVLFFKKNRVETKFAQALRSNLLADPQIFAAYNSTEQYPEWTPHLTMGYPETPAKKDDRGNPGFWGVEFDRIALWTGEYTGPTFKLEYPEREEQETMAMSDEKTGNFFAHYGIKGMKWGKRKVDDTPLRETRITQPKPGGPLHVSGGKGLPAHEDAVKAATWKQQARGSTTNALSNKELKDLVNRMNLEQQYSELTGKAAARNQSAGRKFVKSILGDLGTVGRQEGKNYLQTKAKSRLSGVKTAADPTPRREYDEQFEKARRAAR